jgi:hypothetical protein
VVTAAEALEKIRSETVYEAVNINGVDLMKSRLLLAQALAEIESNWDHEESPTGTHAQSRCRCCIAATALIRTAGGEREVERSTPPDQDVRPDLDALRGRFDSEGITLQQFDRLARYLRRLEQEVQKLTHCMSCGDELGNERLCSGCSNDGWD